ncbi:MAG: hypothetical protein HY280_03815 [Nitrospinae bacterium]|nr:hypothetical protein [Nitrospinota bacterium]
MSKLLSGLAGLFLISASCGGFQPSAPSNGSSKTTVKLNLPDGVSLKSGGVRATTTSATVTGITLTVSAPDMAVPITHTIPLDTLQLSIDVPTGGARTFSVYVATDYAGTFYGYQTTDLTTTDISLTISISAFQDAWMPRASMPTSRLFFGTAAVNGVIYTIGGTFDLNGSNGPYNTVEAYDTATNTWSTKAPMPTARYLFGTAVVNGIIYAIGGYTYNGGAGAYGVTTVEAYDPSSNT